MTWLTWIAGSVLVLCVAGAIACRWGAKKLDKDFSESLKM